MKIVMTETIKWGADRFEKGAEKDLPDKVAKALIASGKAKEAGVGDDAEAAAPRKRGRPPKASYETRRLKAEDSD
jgi:hypothetical protein